MVKITVAVSPQPTRGRAHFFIPKESACWVQPLKFGGGVSFPHFLFNLGQLWWILGSSHSTKPSSPHAVTPRLPLRRILLLPPNHSSVASDCFQHLPFWHFRRNKIQVWCWKGHIDFFLVRGFSLAVGKMLLWGFKATPLSYIRSFWGVTEPLLSRSLELTLVPLFGSMLYFLRSGVFLWVLHSELTSSWSQTWENTLPDQPSPQTMIQDTHPIVSPSSLPGGWP